MTTKDERKVAQAARSAEVEAKQKELDKGPNSQRTGIGPRLSAGLTRGKNPSVIQFEELDADKPELLPKSVAQFMECTATTEEKDVVNYLIEGFNEVSYKNASDELAEYVESGWDSATSAQFRVVVRNYSRGAGVSIEEAVSLIKPGFAKAVASRV